MLTNRNSNDNINSADKFVLKKRIDLWGVMAITIGSMVGAGIFVSPTTVLKTVNGSVGLSLIIWCACGLITISGCLCYCELGASLKASGRDYLNFKLAYPPIISFLYMWGIKTMGAPAFLIFGRYFASLLYGDCNPHDTIIKLIAILLMFVLYYINYLSVKTSVYVEIAFTIAKFLAMALIAVVGIVRLTRGSPVAVENFQNTFASEPLSQLSVSQISMAVYQGMFAYTGFSAVNMVSEELKEPGKNLPRGCIMAVVAVIMMYLLVNVGYYSVLSAEEMISSKAVGELFGSKTLGPMAWLIPFFVCISTAGNLNGVVLLYSRMWFVAARDGIAPRVFGMIHTRNYVPFASLVANFILGLVLILIGDFYTVVTIFSFMNFLWHGLSAGSVLILRKKYPDLKRPYKAPILCPIFTTCVSAYFVITPFIQNPDPVFVLAIAYEVVVVLCYYLFIVRQFEIPGMRKLNLFLQKLMEIAETEDDFAKNHKNHLKKLSE